MAEAKVKDEVVEETVEKVVEKVVEVPKAVETPKEPEVKGKVWTDEYVTSLREEAKTNRLNRKAAETKLRTILKLADDEEVDDKKVTAYLEEQDKTYQDIISKANDRLIAAEIRNLEGYDAKLVERLLDKSKITIDDEGQVIGLPVAIEELEKEFPQIKKAFNQNTGANPPLQETMSELQQLKKDYEDAVKKGDFALQISLKNQMFKLENK